jgi:Sulfotransferase family
MKVDIMIIGAMKCGTTTLADLLRDHAEVSMCRIKEPEFFSKDPDWRAHLSTYEALFDQAPGKRYAEASTGYTMFPHFHLDVPGEVHAYAPETRFIYIVRDPVERAISHYMHIYERGYTDLSLVQAVKRLPIITDVSRYAMQLQPWILRFGRDRILVLDFDDVVKQRDATLSRVAAHLGIRDQWPEDEAKHSNRSIGGNKTHHAFDKPPRWARIGWMLTPPPFRSRIWTRIARGQARPFAEKPVLPQEWKEVILRMVATDVLEIERMMGKDLTSWWARHGLQRPAPLG